MNGAGRATNYAHGVCTMHARVCHHEVADLRAVSNEPGIVVVGGSAASYTVITMSAPVEIDHHGGGAVDESSLHQFSQEVGGFGIIARAACHQIELFFIALEHRLGIRLEMFKRRVGWEQVRRY